MIVLAAAGAAEPAAIARVAVAGGVDEAVGLAGVVIVLKVAGAVDFAEEGA